MKSVPFFNSICLVMVSFIGPRAGAQAALPLETWLQTEKQISIERLLRNISPAGTVPGTVVASPSKDSPNYYFHWIRDSSLVMEQIVQLYSRAEGDLQEIYLKILRDDTALSLRDQSEPSPEGLGEPRYLVNGGVDTTPWSRPQFDGPALRASSLMRFLAAADSLHRPLEASLRADAIRVIQADLQFVSEKWSQPCYDLWEELKGFHFYTQAVQYSALKMGAHFFQPTDPELSRAFLESSLQVHQELEKYWDPIHRRIGASRNLQLPADSDYKSSNLDTAVILAALHGEFLSGLSDGDSVLSIDPFLSTAHSLEAEFSQIYLLNLDVSFPAIGRFTDDSYFGGNPWYLTTAAFAEFYFRLSEALLKSTQIEITDLNLTFFNSALMGRLQLHSNANPKTNKNQLAVGMKFSPASLRGQELLTALIEKGDGFFRTLRKFTASQGEMSEQFDRQAGVPVSAPDLSWSYASFLSALQAREQVKVFANRLLRSKTKNISK